MYRRICRGESGRAAGARSNVAVPYISVKVRKAVRYSLSLVVVLLRLFGSSPRGVHRAAVVLTLPCSLGSSDQTTLVTQKSLAEMRRRKGNGAKRT